MCKNDVRASHIQSHDGIYLTDIQIHHYEKQYLDSPNSTSTQTYSVYCVNYPSGAGTMYVNNPMLKILAEHINRGEDVEWQKLWNDLEAVVKNNSKAYERFLDYIPPHKNLGAIFIKTYNQMIEQEN